MRKRGAGTLKNRAPDSGTPGSQGSLACSRITDLEFRGVENGDTVLVEIDLLWWKEAFEAVAQGEQCCKTQIEMQ